MQNNQSLVTQTDPNLGYARLPDNPPPAQIYPHTQNYFAPQPYHPNPQYNQPNPIVNQPPQYFQPQAQPYAQPYPPQNFHPGQPYSNQGFLNDENLRENSTKVKCMCLTVIVQNLAYIGLNIAEYGFTLNIILLAMIIQIIRFGVLLSRVKNNIATDDVYRATKSFLLCSTISYSVIFTVVIIITAIATEQSDEKSLAMILLIGSTVIFLLPRTIALLYGTKKQQPQPAVVIVN